MRQTHKLVYRKRQRSSKFWRNLARTEPNNQELQLLGLITWMGLPYRYVGNAGFIINGKSPDFIHTQGDKKIIELFGERWHKKKEEKTRTEFFQKSGYETLIIWSKELSNKNRKLLCDKILLFENGRHNGTSIN